MVMFGGHPAKHTEINLGDGIVIHFRTEIKKATQTIALSKVTWSTYISEFISSPHVRDSSKIVSR